MTVPKKFDKVDAEIEDAKAVITLLNLQTSGRESANVRAQAGHPAGG